MEINTFVKALSRTSYSPARATLFEHIALIRSGRDVVSSSSSAGRPPSLSNDDWDVVAGRIFLETSPVNFDQTIDWIKVNFGIQVFKSIVSRFAKEFGLNVQLTGRRGMTSLDDFDYAQEYLNFLLHLNNLEFFKYDKSKIICLDFVTNSYRLDRQKTISMKGGKQRKFNQSKVQYTDSYLVPAAMKEGLGLKAIIYTFNPVFYPRGTRSEEVMKWCIYLDIDRDRVVWEQSEKHYCKEATDQVSHF